MWIKYILVICLVIYTSFGQDSNVLEIKISEIDLTVIIEGYTNANEVLLFYEGNVSIGKWLRYYGDFYIQ